VKNSPPFVANGAKTTRSLKGKIAGGDNDERKEKRELKTRTNRLDKCSKNRLVTNKANPIVRLEQTNSPPEGTQKGEGAK